MPDVLPTHLAKVREDWDSNSSRGALLEFLSSSIQRINDLERHLVGVATLASAGWAFIHREPFKDDSSRLVFAIMFAGLVASSYNALYLARSAVNQRLIEIEQLLGLGYTPYLKTLRTLGKQAAGIVYLSTALFIPLMALVSVLLCARSLPGLTDPLVQAAAWLLWAISLAVIVWTSGVNVLGLRMVSGIAHQLLQQRMPTSQVGASRESVSPSPSSAK
jgi:hypothetical protein